ncbi:MAG: FecR domain-containing protein [Planctomycetota bacterium]|nr:FecR domain-containing protein [Planctomycetota bacterium]
MNEEELNLLHRYLDGALEPEEMESLENLLLTNPEARSTLRSLATIDAKWQELATADDDVLAGEANTAPAGVWSTWQTWISLGSLAAMLLLGLSVWWSVNTKPDAPVLGIARVILVEGEVRADEKRVLSDGDELFAGETLTMSSGLIELAFRETGVHVLATAPLSIELDSTERVLLHEGEMKLVVPPQGVGFVVDTPKRMITDLGTSFVVSVRDQSSKVLVLDGAISMDDRKGNPEQILKEGDLAKINRNGKTKLRSQGHPDIPELSLPSMKLSEKSLKGLIVGREGLPLGSSKPAALPRKRLGRSGPPRVNPQDLIGEQLMPLIQSGFQDRTCLEPLKQAAPIRFNGIAGSYVRFPNRAGLEPFAQKTGWLAWYQGQVVPPQPGRYRFWGYADNHLLVAIDGKPVFEGSRRDSPFKKLGIPRTDNPSLPCLNATAGFACSQWIKLDGKPLQLDILFGERAGSLTSGLLLIEREGETYEETSWGQPKWPLFLTEAPSEAEVREMENLRLRMEEKLMGSFSIDDTATWRVAL